MSNVTDSSLSPIVRGADEGQVYHVAQHSTRCILPAEATGGAFSLFEITSPPGDRVPLHTHTREDETFIVLEGEMDLTIDGVTHRLTPGMTAFGPRGIPHGFANNSGAPARLYVITSPGGFERFFAEVHERLPRTAAFDPALFVEIIRKHGMIVDG